MPHRDEILSNYCYHWVFFPCFQWVRKISSSIPSSRRHGVKQQTWVKGHIVGAPQQRSCLKSWWLSSLDAKKSSAKAHLSRQLEQVMSSNARFECWMATSKKTSGCCSVMPKGQCWKRTQASKEICTNPISVLHSQGWTGEAQCFTSPVNVRRSCITCFQCWSLQVTRWGCLEMRPKRSQEKHLTNRFHQLTLENIKVIDVIATWACHNCFHGLLTSHTLDDWCQSSMKPLRLLTWSNSVTKVESCSGPSTAALTAVLSEAHVWSTHALKILASRASLNS